MKQQTVRKEAMVHVNPVIKLPVNTDVFMLIGWCVSMHELSFSFSFYDILVAPICIASSKKKKKKKGEAL